MFWGIQVQSGGPHAILIPDNYSLSVKNVCLDVQGLEDKEAVISVYVLVEGKNEHLLTVLDKNHPSHVLGLDFIPTDKISFLVKGPDDVAVHLIGYLEEEDVEETSYDDGSGGKTPREESSPSPEPFQGIRRWRPLKK